MPLRCWRVPEQIRVGPPSEPLERIQRLAPDVGYQNLRPHASATLQAGRGRRTSATRLALISRLPSFSLRPVSSTAALVLSDPVPSTRRRFRP